MNQQQSFSAQITTPLGWIGIQVIENALEEVRFLPQPIETDDFLPEAAQDNRVILDTIRQIRAYFALSWHKNSKKSFNLPLRLRGTEFQQAVWQELQKIPPGETRSYGFLAQQLRTSPRAVGNACRANPCAIVVPCHRVISQKGVGGYGGRSFGVNLLRKKWLLQHEGIDLTAISPNPSKTSS